ncbi:MAG: DUF1045 domain-containing protein [Pseudorhodobacter sp.]|nr:MAG: DUF1045 domain-containing protein [Pseudorhodobacter sp.]
MDQMKRFAIYFAPRDGAFADAAAGWLGWDARSGQVVAQPDVPGLATLTAEPRRYGFHATIKPPFRLNDDTRPEDLSRAVADLAANLPQVRMDGLSLGLLEGFLALTPLGDPGRLRDFAAKVVQGLEGFRAPLTPDEIARRRPDTLTPRQRELLAVYGYPFVMEEFQLHLTLSGRLEPAQALPLRLAAERHFAGLLPQPFVIEDLCLFGEDKAGRFHLLHRYPLSA